MSACMRDCCEFIAGKQNYGAWVSERKSLDSVRFNESMGRNSKITTQLCILSLFGHSTIFMLNESLSYQILVIKLEVIEFIYCSYTISIYASQSFYFYLLHVHHPLPSSIFKTLKFTVAEPHIRI